jgi:SAM-dependent methyltransferase
MRLEGLEPLLDSARDATVLDLGCFDGLIAYEFFRAGANLVHGVDNDARHLETAERIFSQAAIPSRFAHADLRQAGAVGHALGEQGLATYDIVLFLGVFQHIFRAMSAERRRALVADVAGRTGGQLAVRIPGDVFDEFEKLIPAGTLEPVGTVPQVGHVGQLRIYRRA